MLLLGVDIAVLSFRYDHKLKEYLIEGLRTLSLQKLTELSIPVPVSIRFLKIYWFVLIVKFVSKLYFGVILCVTRLNLFLLNSPNFLVFSQSVGVRWYFLIVNATIDLEKRMFSSSTSVIFLTCCKALLHLS